MDCNSGLVSSDFSNLGTVLCSLCTHARCCSPARQCDAVIGDGPHSDNAWLVDLRDECTYRARRGARCEVGHSKTCTVGSHDTLNRPSRAVNPTQSTISPVSLSLQGLKAFLCLLEVTLSRMIALSLTPSCYQSLESRSCSTALHWLLPADNPTDQRKQRWDVRSDVEMNLRIDGKQRQ